MTSALQTSEVEEAVERVLSDPLYWFPVRHHSPAASKHVRDAILERKPKMVFIEGPPEGNELVRYVVDSKTRPPVAIYSSFRDDDNVLGLAGRASPAPDIPPRFASWYPLVEYSPEYVAMKAAAEVSAEVRFIDLPHYARLSSAEPEEKAGTEEKASYSPSEGDFYGALARAAGFRDWTQAWDGLFEFGEGMHEREVFRRELAIFCAAARESSDPQLLEQDGTLERERAFLANIAAGLAEKGLGPEDVMVVCGGFHLFLDREDTTPPPETPEGTVYTSLVPYSFFQISELSGYRAGNRAPRFFQSVWKNSGDHDALLANHVVEVLKKARREGAAVSSADGISITQHARMLANLRRRPHPILDDLHDAIMTCCCKGDPQSEGQPLQRAIDAVDIGNRIGKITPSLDRLPLLSDFHLRLEQHDLSKVVKRQKVLRLVLDTREEEEQATAAFLHRLSFLEISLPKLTSLRGGGLGDAKLFEEKWQLKWTPETEPGLVEKNLYGDSVEMAAMALLTEKMVGLSKEAAASCSLLREAVQMELPELLLELESTCREALEEDPKFTSLAGAIRELRVLQRMALHGALSEESVERLLVRGFQRSCFALADSASAKPEEEREVVEALRTVGELVLQERAGEEEELYDRDLLINQILAAEQSSQSAFLRGAFVGLGMELRALSAEEGAERVAAYAEETFERMIEAGDFLHGMLSASKAALLLGGDALMEATDKLLHSADWNHFLVMLPRLRLAFEQLTEHQRLTMARRVAQHYGLAERDEEQLTDLGASPGASALFTRIDLATAKMMKEWEL